MLAFYENMGLNLGLDVLLIGSGGPSFLGLRLHIYLGFPEQLGLNLGLIVLLIGPGGPAFWAFVGIFTWAFLHKLF